MLNEDINNTEDDNSVKEESTSNLVSKQTSYTSGTDKEITYVATPHPARRERSTNLQIFSFIIVIDALCACLFIGVFMYLGMSVPMYISVGVVSLVALGDLVFLIYTLIVYKKKIKIEDERIKEERYQRMKEKENSNIDSNIN
ncbi:MAG: hypothetical protein LUD22_04230 [Coprobacillus sp.]|nr:hypothetical protein [Coprobacillus sp.]